jgi:hypothetical protein
MSDIWVASYTVDPVVHKYIVALDGDLTDYFLIVITVSDF